MPEPVHETRAVTLPLVPLPGGVIVPQMVVNLVVDRDDERRAVEAAQGADQRAVLVPQVGGRYARVGTIASIEQVEPGPRGTQVVLLRGLERAVIGTGQVGEAGALWVRVEPVDETVTIDPRATELAREYRAVLDEILTSRRAARVRDMIAGITDPGTLADTAVYSPDLSVEQKVEVLETLDVAARLEKVLGWARDTLADLTLRERVREQVGDKMERQQREYLLRQQLQAIREELGETDGDVAAEYRTRLAETDLPEHVRVAAEREVDRLERMGEQNPEHGWIRTWLDTVLDVPWGVRTDDTLDLAGARAQLDADHTGLDEPKERIVEFLALRSLRAERAMQIAEAAASTGTRPRGLGAILALVGPPGVGKTSLGESVAAALGRRFVRVALGGIRDEAEIRGHRRTYVGAQPGRLVRALREAGAMNPVILLDEVDKVAADWRGDPTAALLEVLDPAQNHTFRDHYLEVELDLSEVLFLATANVLDTIPAPLLDRLDVIRLDGYTDDEKVAIATTHLLPRQLEQAALRPQEVTVTDAAVAAVVDGYTREAGVRALERQLGKLVRKAATRLVTGAATPPVTVDVDDLRELLGRPPVEHEVAERTGVPGVATGLAVTGNGGDVLFVEATAMPGEPGLTLTGQLGDVMQESARIALSYVRGHAAALGVDPEALAGRHVHLHVPAGAVPKDGPSAGVTMVTALTSLLTGRPVRGVVGMTGEVTLQGKVLPIGGVKQKILAAHRAGLTEVVLPARNAGDLDDVPEAVRQAMTFHVAADIADVLGVALEPAARPAAA
jgi:ATP-dependent Lon protease